MSVIPEINNPYRIDISQDIADQVDAMMESLRVTLEDSSLRPLPRPWRYESTGRKGMVLRHPGIPGHMVCSASVAPGLLSGRGILIYLGFLWKQGRAETLAWRAVRSAFHCGGPFLLLRRVSDKSMVAPTSHEKLTVNAWSTIRTLLEQHADGVESIGRLLSVGDDEEVMGELPRILSADAFGRYDGIYTRQIAELLLQSSQPHDLLRHLRVLYHPPSHMENTL